MDTPHSDNIALITLIAKSNDRIHSCTEPESVLSEFQNMICARELFPDEYTVDDVDAYFDTGIKPHQRINFHLREIIKVGNERFDLTEADFIAYLIDPPSR